MFRPANAPDEMEQVGQQAASPDGIGHEFFNKPAEWRTAVRWFLLVEDEVCTFVQRRNHSAVYCRGFGRATRKWAIRYTSAFTVGWIPAQTATVRQSCALLNCMLPAQALAK